MALQAPEGTKDLLPDEAKFWAHFKATAADMFGRYGYVTIETPVFEQTELFVRGIGEATDVVSKEMFTAISGENLNKLLGGGTIKGQVAYRDMDNTKDVDFNRWFVALGYDYPMSKRTSFFAMTGYTQEKVEAANREATPYGFEFTAGILHRF